VIGAGPVMAFGAEGRKAFRFGLCGVSVGLVGNSRNGSSKY